MRIDWAIPCGGVQIEDDGRVSAINDPGFDTLWVEPFPSEVQFIVLLRIAGLPDDFKEGADRAVEAYLTGPEMDPLISIDFEFPAGEPGPDYMEGWELTRMVPLVIQFTPHAEGTHSLDLYVHSRHQNCSTFFQIKAGVPTG
jgi:hypothetical protein